MEKQNKKDAPTQPVFKVADRRFWNETEESSGELGQPSKEGVYPSFVENLLKQNETKEARLKEASRQIKLMREEGSESKKRLERNLEKEMNSMKANFFRSFVDIVDNIDRSVDYAREKNSQFEKFLDGVLLIQAQIKDKLKEHQVVPMDLSGKKFDPSCGEAIDLIHTDNPTEEELILGIHQNGYLLGDLVIRPARVSVGKYVAPPINSENPKKI